MSTPQTAHTRIAQMHRNLKSLATVATPATTRQAGAYSRCQSLKKVATSGNTHTFLHISGRHFQTFWLSLLPLKKHWQQNTGIGNVWRPRLPGLLPLLPLLPVFLKTVEHVISGKSAEVAQ